MLHSYPTLPPNPSPQMSFSPLRSKRRIDHERHGSEVVQRPRPFSVTSHPVTQQHSKRASMYVNDASVILAQRTPMASPTSPLDSLLSPTPEFIDHYAILELDPHASRDDILASYRRLRVVYFKSDAKKYRALQAAFDVLMDPEARLVYDSNYPTHAPSFSSIEEVMEQLKRDRKDSALGDDDVIAEEEDIEATRSQDPNWALKRHQRLHDPLIGTEPYQSFIPILEVYEGVIGEIRHPSMMCSRPTYVGEVAKNARPI